MITPCVVDGCDRAVECRGMCHNHYENARRRGLIAVQPKRCAELIEDVEWMVSTGETHAEAVARRLGSNPKAVARRLARLGRGDLICRLDGSYSDFAQGKRA